MKDNWLTGNLGVPMLVREKSERDKCTPETAGPEGPDLSRGSSKIPYLLVNTGFCVSNLV